MPRALGERRSLSESRERTSVSPLGAMYTRHPHEGEGLTVQSACKVFSDVGSVPARSQFFSAMLPYNPLIRSASL